MSKEQMPEFDQLCREHNLAATHQRRIIFHAVTVAPGHYSPEQIYDAVREEIPSISLATVYKNLKTFVEAGILREVSPHHGTLRVDPNLEPHHHLVCRKCKSITDIDAKFLDPVRVRRAPAGFNIEQFSVDILGVCSKCSSPLRTKTKGSPAPKPTSRHS
jgi:Fur family peroxide stress response transcriptional regulator